MKHEPATPPEVIGLDIGTSRVVSARQAEAAEAVIEAQLNAFVSIPYSKLTARSLEREAIPHVVADGQIVVYGNESARIADMIGSEIRRPMTRGVLNSAEPESLVQMREIMRYVIGECRNPSTKVCFSVPAAPLGSEDNLTYHEATVKQALGQLGYNDVRSVNEGMAVIYSELEDSNYTGLGVSCGGGLCNVAVGYMSMPVLSFSIAKGGDYIDSSAANVTGELANRVRMIKEEGFRFNGGVGNNVQQALKVYYDDLIQSIVLGLKEALSATRSIPRFNRPVPLVLSGGCVVPDGFRERFDKALAMVSLPIPISDVRQSPKPLEATARGALVAALSE